MPKIFHGMIPFSLPISKICGILDFGTLFVSHVRIESCWIPPNISESSFLEWVFNNL